MLGVEAIVAESGDDITALARSAVAAGADVIGMAGGDGCQGVVAAVAAEHGLAYVCIPAGTRNHFAADLGIDRSDVAGALDAFFSGTDRMIDLAVVNGRVFVNNASMGLYGELVQSQAYRDAKIRTALEMLPELIGPDADPADLRFSAPDGTTFPDAQLLLVSNNPYEIGRPGVRGTRGQLNSGRLGVVTLRMAPPLPRRREWSAPSFRVDSGGPVHLGLDGEAMVLDPPLLFESRPVALRVRVVAAGRPPFPPPPRPLPPLR